MHFRLQAAIFTHPDKRQCLDHSSRVAWHWKHRLGVGSLLLSCIQAEIYFIPYPLPVQTAIFDALLTLTWENSHYSPTMFMDLNNGGFPWMFADISFVSWDPSYIRSISRHFEFLWEWLKILRHLRHHKKSAWAPPTSRWKPDIKFKSVPEIQGDAAYAGLPAVYVTQMK